MADEAIDSTLRSNKGIVFYKIDIEKVNDHVGWSFLSSMMGKMGFGEKRIG